MKAAIAVNIAELPGAGKFATACALRFLRQPSRPNAPTPGGEERKSRGEQRGSLILVAWRSCSARQPTRADQLFFTVCAR